MRAANRLNLDYRALSTTFSARNIIDIHTHIHGARAAKVFLEVADLYGIQRIFTMSQLELLDEVVHVCGRRLIPIAFPRFGGSDIVRDHGVGYWERITQFRQFGARIVKFWCPPRVYEWGDAPAHRHPLRINSEVRFETMKAAADAGMLFMVHIADPDTWFSVKYSDAGKYGTKDNQYEWLEAALEAFPVPWIGAHMGGSPEDLPRLSRLLETYPHFYLDCSATKWVVRELSKHSLATVREFFIRWQGRILFGSDIVTNDQHLAAGEKSHEMYAKASSEEEAFELYASRYWALRTLFETTYEGESPIADPDLAMVAPEQFTALDAPPLRGLRLPDEVLSTLYYGAAKNLYGSLEE